MTTILMVAEKPMLADSIGRLLSDGKSKKRKGWNGACSISEYSGQFNGRAVRFKVTSTCGHVMSMDFQPKYNNWEKIDPMELFVAPTEKKECSPKLRMNQFLASEAKGCSALVLWLDCDKEGENICFEVVDAVKNALELPKSGDVMEVVYRAHFSAITEKDIKSAMRNLGRPNRNESLAVDARQELDLRIGCSFTRFQTRFFQVTTIKHNWCVKNMECCSFPGQIRRSRHDFGLLRTLPDSDARILRHQTRSDCPIQAGGLLADSSGA